MNSWKHFILFTKNNGIQLKRKWTSLPLLFIIPIIVVGLIIVMITSFFLPDENHPIKIGLVDQDKTTETEMVTKLIEGSSQLSEYIHIKTMSEPDAITSMTNNEISTYIIFPNDFTNNLYQGISVELPIIGNPNKQLESLFIREIIESVVRHIRSSQANILTINEYAKEVGLNSEERHELLFEQFKEFVFYTLGSSQIVKEKEIHNAIDDSPIHYFGTSLFFIISSIWLMIVYNFLYTDSQKNMGKRMRLYNVTQLQQILARIFVANGTVQIFSIILIIALSYLLHIDLSHDEFLKIIVINLLYSGTFLAVFGLIEVLLSSYKIRLFGQSMMVLLHILLSGAVIPAIYLPMWIQDVLPYYFAHETFYWLIEIIVNNRVYTDFIPILLMTVVAFFILCGISIGKERVKA